MKKIAKLFKHFDFVLLDLLVLLISFLVSNILYLGSLSYYDSFTYGNILTMLLLSFIFTFIIIEPYSDVLKRNNIEELRNSIKTSAYNLVSTVLLLYIIKFSASYSRVVIVLTHAMFGIVSFIVRTLWKKHLLRKSNIKTELLKSLLIVSEKDNIKQILENINQDSFKQYDVKGICLIDVKTSNKNDDIKSCCNVNKISDYAITNNISEVFFAVAPDKIDKELITKLLDNGIQIQLRTEDIFGLDTDVKDIENIGVFSTYAMKSFSLSSAQMVYLVFKRLFDIVFSLVGLLLMGIMALILIPINHKNGDRGPIFYKHLRVGKDGKEFYLYKFRTMYTDADDRLKELLKKKKYKEQWNEYHKLDDDPRITKVGSFLRRTSLDELPQFINVFIGNMSLIGPRPLAIDELKQHNGLRLYERVKPGITGWWACNGRSNITYKERLELEYYYVRNISFYLDILVLFRTIYCVIKKSGAK